MEITKKQIIWIILFFGSLIGLNETLIGSIHIQYKSVILSAITLSLFAFARYLLPHTGTTLLVMVIAVLYKLTCLGVSFCKPTMVILLGLGFELFANIFIRKQKHSYISFVLTSVLSSIVTFFGFAFFETFIVKNEYWGPEKFNDYIFVKAPLTALASTLLTLLGVFIIKILNPEFVDSILKKPILTQIILGLFVFSIWVVGFVSMQYKFN